MGTSSGRSDSVGSLGKSVVGKSSEEALVGGVGSVEGAEKLDVWMPFRVLLNTECRTASPLDAVKL